MADKDDPITEVSAHIAELSSLHMSFVLANVIGAVINSVPPEQRQTVFYRLGAAAHTSVDNVQGAIPERTKREVQALTKVYVEHTLKAVAGQFGLKLPEIEEDGPTSH